MGEIINSFGLDWKIFTAEIVNFSVILALLYFFVFKKIFTQLEARKKIIEKGIQNSEKSQEILR